jgi:hypothetical protein
MLKESSGGAIFLRRPFFEDLSLRRLAREIFKSRHGASEAPKRDRGRGAAVAAAVANGMTGH